MKINDNTPLGAASSTLPTPPVNNNTRAARIAQAETSSPNANHPPNWPPPADPSTDKQLAFNKEGGSL